MTSGGAPSSGPCTRGGVPAGTQRGAWDVPRRHVFGSVLPLTVPPRRAKTPLARYCVGDVGGERGDRLIEAAYEALAEGGLDRFLEHWTEDLDHRAIEGALDDRGPLHGREAMRAYIQDWMNTLMGSIHPIELIDGGGNTVAAVLRFSGRAKLSGVATDSTFGVVFSIRDGRVGAAASRPGSRPSKPPACRE